MPLLGNKAIQWRTLAARRTLPVSASGFGKRLSDCRDFALYSRLAAVASCRPTAATYRSTCEWAPHGCTSTVTSFNAALHRCCCRHCRCCCRHCRCCRLRRRRSYRANFYWPFFRYDIFILPIYRSAHTCVTDKHLIAKQFQCSAHSISLPVQFRSVLLA